MADDNPFEQFKPKSTASSDNPFSRFKKPEEPGIGERIVKGAKEGFGGDIGAPSANPIHAAGNIGELATKGFGAAVGGAAAGGRALIEKYFGKGAGEETEKTIKSVGGQPTEPEGKEEGFAGGHYDTTHGPLRAFRSFVDQITRDMQWGFGKLGEGGKAVSGALGASPEEQERYGQDVQNITGGAAILGGGKLLKGKEPALIKSVEPKPPVHPEAVPGMQRGATTTPGALGPENAAVQGRQGPQGTTPNEPKVAPPDTKGAPFQPTRGQTPVPPLSSILSGAKKYPPVPPYTASNAKPESSKFAFHGEPSSTGNVDTQGRNLHLPKAPSPEKVKAYEQGWLNQPKVAPPNEAKAPTPGGSGALNVNGKKIGGLKTWEDFKKEVEQAKKLKLDQEQAAQKAKADAKEKALHAGMSAEMYEKQKNAEYLAKHNLKLIVPANKPQPQGWQSTAPKLSKHAYDPNDAYEKQKIVDIENYKKHPFGQHDPELSKFYQDMSEAGEHPYADGLSMDTPDRIKRAKAQGFNTDLTLFHSTNKEFAAFDPQKGKHGETALFFSDKPGIAESYGSGKGQNVIPVYGRMKNPLIIDWPSQGWGSGYSNHGMKKLIAQAKAQKNDVIIVKNMYDMGSSHKQTQYVFLHPKDVRAKYGAAFNPKMAKSANMLGAAASAPGKALEDRPTRDIISDQSDRFYKIQKQYEADKLEFSKMVKALPKVVKDPKLQERIYRYLEGEQVQLTPTEQRFADTVMSKLKAEEKKLYEDIRLANPKFKDADLDEMDPNYMHRAVKGKTPSMDQFTQANKDVVTGQTKKGLTRTTSSLQRRLFYALEAEDGERIVVAQDPKTGNLQKVHNGHYTPLQTELLPNYHEIKPGAIMNVDRKPYIMTHARTSELETHTGYEYHKNALANTIDNVVKLRHVKRSLAELKRLTESPEWEKYAVRRKALTQPPPNDTMKAPDVPLFQDWFVDKHYANLIEDTYKSRDPDKWTKLNQIATRALFWQPVTHAMNVGVHWYVARGWDWLTPTGWARLIKTLPKAAKQVATMGPEMSRLMRQGAAMMAPAAETRNFYHVIMNKVGEDMKKAPAKWDPIARVFGVSVPQLFDAYYRGVSKMLWMSNDVFMMQRVLELEEKGYSTQRAIHAAELHIPNYRVPTGHTNTQRLARQALMHPAAFQFSPYHYGIWRSYAHMVKDVVTGAGEGRMEALGHMMALGSLLFAVYPFLETALQSEYPDLGLRRAGAATIPQALLDVFWTGSKTFSSAVTSSIAFAPASKELIEQLLNRDTFTGKEVAPGDTAARQAVERTSHAAQSLVPPTQTVERARQNQSKAGGDIVGNVLTQAGKDMLGVQDRQRQLRGAHYGQQAAKREEKSRRKRPQGLVEDLYKNIGGILGP